ncbi:MAG: GvpL/GvpF family gas vesicle protein [Leptolyngbya sp.]|nr:GvpL/GvpF family gas vesicle protein [Leptolyngbya sp.]
MATRYYLYGIFPAPGPKAVSVTGLDDQPVEAWTLDNFTFLYSQACQKRYLASRYNLLAHEKVLESAMQQGFHTLLPLQFGLTVSDWDQVKEDLLTPYRAMLTQLFQRLDGCREVSVKVMWDAARELEMLMTENDDLRHQRDQLEGTQLSMEQVIAIGQQIEAALNERQEHIADQFRQALSPLAKDAIENDPMTDTMIFNVAYLIPWGAESAFSRALDEVDATFGDRLRVRYNNFTAPYNFAQLQ